MSSDYEQVEFVCRDGSIEMRDIGWCIAHSCHEVTYGVWSGPWYGKEEGKLTTIAVVDDAENVETAVDAIPETNDSSTTTCHALPCDIDYTGKAPVYLYFRPQPLQDTPNAVNNDKTAQLAAQFRGRGLLAAAPTAVHGRMLTVNNNNHIDNTVTVSASFSHCTEWHHEHQSAQVKLNVQHFDRVTAATNWFPIAAALHAPIPVGVDATAQK